MRSPAGVLGHPDLHQHVVLTECGGIISRAARRSGLSERNFHEKLKKYGISGKTFRAGVTGG